MCSAREDLGSLYKVKATIFVKKIPIEAKFAVKEYFPDICSRQEDNATIKIPETKHDEVVDGIKDFINEGKKLQDLCDLNPNIVNVNEVFEANGTAYYVLEYLEGGDLRKMVRNNGGALTEQQMLDVMVPIGHAVQCLHDNNILHLDIKPDNIVMRRTSDGNVEPVLIDFGIAVHFRNDGTPTSKTPSQGISPGYSPIEQYSLIKTFDPRIDVYAFSATCLYLLTGKDPVEAFDITPATQQNEVPQTVSPHIAHAITHAMSKDKYDRTSSLDELMREMQKSKESVQIESKDPLQMPENDTVNLAEKAAAVSKTAGEKKEIEKKSVNEEKPASKPKAGVKPLKYGSTDAKPLQHSIDLKKKEDKRKKGLAMMRNSLIFSAICVALIVGLTVLPKKCSNSNQEKGTSENKVMQSSKSFSQEIVQNGPNTNDINDSLFVTSINDTISDKNTKENKNSTHQKTIEKNINTTHQKTIEKQITESLLKSISSSEEYSLMPSNVNLDNTCLKAMIKEYNDLCLKYKKISATSTDENPVIIDVQQTLISQRNSILSYLKTLLKELEAQEKVLMPINH